jgi:carboxyl-terminal processing protease
LGAYEVGFMPKSMKISLMVALCIMVFSLALGSGCVISFGTPAPTQGPNQGLINEAWKIISRNYVEPGRIDSTTLNEGALKGMVQGLDDPYSAYLNSEAYQFEQSDLQGSFGGIGASVSINREKEPIIVAPMEGSPAEKAGIKTGDVILAINDKPTEGLSLLETISLVRGPVGTSVRLLILHQGTDTPVELEIVRAEIQPRFVEYQMKGNTAYIRIFSFGERTNQEVNTALQSMDLKKAKGIILDLRSNPGGLVTALVDVASHFIKEGVVITLRDNQGKTTSESVRPNGVYTMLPLVVLVDQYSASASEVLSGALQDYKRATIAGAVTLGKGSYNSFFELNDGSAIYLTIGRWLTPKGREIEGKGITPDYVLTQTGDDAIQWAIDFLNKAE